MDCFLQSFKKNSSILTSRPYCRWDLIYFYFSGILCIFCFSSSLARKVAWSRFVPRTNIVAGRRAKSWGAPHLDLFFVYFFGLDSVFHFFADGTALWFMVASTKYIYIHLDSWVPECMSPRRWDSPTPSPASEFAPPPPGNQKGGGHTRMRVRGWGSPNSDDWSKNLVLTTLWWLVGGWKAKFRGISS